MKRVFKIILAILVIIAIILVIAWLRSRHAAKEQGTQAQNFRQFLGLGSVTPAEAPAQSGTDLVPNGTQVDTTDSGTDGTGTPTEGSTTATSQFTSGPISPTQNNSTAASGSGNTTAQGNGGSSTGGSSGSSGTSGTSTGPSITTVTPPGPGAYTATLTAQCTDADLTIEFTTDEITRLNALQNRFYAVAAYLHSDADVQNELINHDEFKAKTDQITELYNYCVAQSPKIGGVLYTNRVSTPFWRVAAFDGAGYMIKGSNDIPLTTYAYDPRDPSTDSVLERIFKLNLW